MNEAYGSNLLRSSGMRLSADVDFLGEIIYVIQIWVIVGEEGIMLTLWYSSKYIYTGI